MSENLTIRKLIDRLTSGDIRIPAFQRGYVWDPSQVAFLIDSLYKGYPIGTVFLWNTSSRLKNERNLGNFLLPEPKKDYPVNYVLDGQQRITSIFSVFQSELTPVGNGNWTDIYFDVQTDNSPQETCFYALNPSEVVDSRHFPMNTLFESRRYREATAKLPPETVTKIDKLQETFKEVMIPVQEFTTDERERVAIVFERINRAGTELDTYQLLTAWSWSEDFDLQEKLEELKSELSPFGFGNAGSDKDLILKCFAGNIKKSVAPRDIMALNGDEIRANFEMVKEGIKGAVDFLKRELKVCSYDILPYPAMIVSLSQFFATEKTNGKRILSSQRKTLMQWFWRSNFKKRYSAGVTAAHEMDLREMEKLSSEPNHPIWIEIPDILPAWFVENQFNVNTINTKTYIISLANADPRSFISGSKVDLEKVLKVVNRNEFHHIYPKKYLESLRTDWKQINAIANICFLSSADNQAIKDQPPKIYQKHIPESTKDQICDSAKCPRRFFDFDFAEFIEKRTILLAEYSHKLCEFGEIEIEQA